MSRTRVAIVGITGDPPTMGHIWLAQTADMTGNFDLVWMMPCYQHKFKKLPTENSSTIDHRFAMTVIAANEAGGNVRPSAYEIERQSKGSCYNTTLSIREDYPNWDITWVIGLDNALYLDAWENAPALKQGFVPFLVCQRGGIETPQSTHWFNSLPHRFVQGVDCVECSSTEFKKLYKRGDNQCLSMVSPGVFAYIQKNKLYVGDQ